MSTADEAPGKRIRGHPESTRTQEWKPGEEGAHVLCRVFDIGVQVLKVPFGDDKDGRKVLIYPY